MGRFSTSLELAKSSWRVLRTDKQLAVIPVVSFIVTVAVVILLGGAIVLSLDHTTVSTSSTVSSSAVTGTTSASSVSAGPLTIVLGVIAYLAVTFVVTFFTAALVGGAHERLTGGDPTLGSSFAAASKRLPQIFLWSLLSGTIGLILQSIESRSGLIGQILARSVGMAWRVITFLAIPVIIAEGPGPFVALKRAASLFKSTWGENLIGQGALGIVGFLAVLPGLAVGILLMAVQPVVGIAVFVAWLLVVSTVMAALNGIYRTALYLYATGQPVTWFDHQVLASAFRPRAGVL